MDGWQFAGEFRRLHDRRAPVVVLTAAEDAQTRTEEIGAEHYLGKPFEINDLIRTVEEHTGR